MLMTRRIVIVATCAAVTAAGCGGGGSAKPRPSSTSSGTQSAATDAPFPTPPLPHGVITSIATNSNGPTFEVDAFGSVWVTTHRGRSLDRIDPQSDQMVQVDLNQNSCSPVYPTPTRLLISACDDGTDSLVVDPKTNQVVGSIRGFVYDYAFGSAWFSDASDRLLQRVDLATRHRITVAHLYVGTVVHALGKLWVAE